jgi:FkbM family methyltransferase
MDTQELLKSASREQIESWCRKNAQSLYLGDRVLCRVLGKYLMVALSDDRSLTPHLALDGYWEIWITMAIAQFVRPGMTCIDVGANVGYYSVLMADWVGPTGTVVAVEPEARNYAALEANLENASATVHAHHVAASDRVGKAHLTVVRDHGGNHTLEKHSSPSAEFSSETVDTMTLDELTRYLPRVDLIKMDVEGHERKVWLGMLELLKRFPRVQIVAEWLRGCDPECELGQMAEQAGFYLHEVMPDGKLRPIALSEVPQAEWRMLWCVR